MIKLKKRKKTIDSNLKVRCTMKFRREKYMIKIGEFASLFNVTIKTVRLYEEKKILFPALVDIYTGYRYYDEKNIEEMTKILILKDLGLSLKEIKTFDFDKTQIQLKIKEYEKEAEKIKENINTLKSLSQSKEVIKDMKSFINDQDVIGKWKLLGVSENVEKAYDSKFDEDDFNIKELYFLPGGEKYWVISWTKGIVFLKGVACEYHLKENKMYLNVIDPLDKTFYKVAVYEKIDNKEYSISEIGTKDDINVPFIEDLDLIGCWKSVDFINDKDSFDPERKNWKESLFLEKIIVSPDNDCIVMLSNSENTARQIKYTKDYLINLIKSDTLSKYEHLNINNENYIVVEWKFGDYVYGKMIYGYYVLKKI